MSIRRKSAGQLLCSATIYAMAHPDAPTVVRYVGVTIGNLLKRFDDHLSQANRWKCPKNDWINSLKKHGKKPVIWVLEFCPVEIWQDVEREWIAYYRQFGRLLNVTDGGDCGPDMTGYKHSPETRAKVSNALKGRVPPRHVIERSIEVNTGSKRSESTKALLRADWVKRKATGWKMPEPSRRVSNSNLRSIKSPVVCKETNRVYESIAEAARDHSVWYNQMKYAVNSGKKINGFTFQYNHVSN